MQEISIRDFEPSLDSGFVYDSWLNSYTFRNPYTAAIPKKILLIKHTALLNRLVPGIQIRMAVKADDPDIIVGYIAFEKKAEKILHYVYVKQAFRKFGICKKLLVEHGLFDGVYASHLTSEGRKIALKMGYKYCPYFSFYDEKPLELEVKK